MSSANGPLNIRHVASKDATGQDYTLHQYEFHHVDHPDTKFAVRMMTYRDDPSRAFIVAISPTVESLTHSDFKGMHEQFANTVGVKGVRQLSRFIRERHPQVKILEGDRVTGTRAGNSKVVEVKLHKSHPDIYFRKLDTYAGIHEDDRGEATSHRYEFGEHDPDSPRFHIYAMTFARRPSELHISTIEPAKDTSLEDAHKRFANHFGVGGMRYVLKRLREDHPNAKTLHGFRVTGMAARAKGQDRLFEDGNRVQVSLQKGVQIRQVFNHPLNAQLHGYEYEFHHEDSPDKKYSLQLTTDKQTPHEGQIESIYASDASGSYPQMHKEFANTFGVKGVRELARHLRAFHPELKALTGARVTGVRANSKEVEKQFVRVSLNKAFERALSLLK